MLPDEHGRPVQENVFQHQEGHSGIRSSAGRDTGYVGSISSISSIAELQAINKAAWAGIGVRRRRRA
jgi:hypothetical protein